MTETTMQDVFTLQIRRHSNVSPSPYCEACKNGFVHVNSLQVRQFTQSGKLPGVCKACNEAFLKICRLQIRHLTQTSSHSHSCPYCNKSFTHAGNIKKHILTHEKKQSENGQIKTDKPEPPFICKYCSKSFVKYGSYLKHVDKHTQPDGDYANEEIQDSEMNNGENSTANIENGPKDNNDCFKPFKCERCGKGFIRHGCLLRHFLIHEAEEFVCKLCNEVFKSKPLLSSHMRIHKHVCKLCKEAFAVPEDLEVHLQNHMLEQNATIASEKVANYVCSICGKGFVHVGFYQKHLRTMHPNTVEASSVPKPKVDQKTRIPLHCSICNQRFRFRRTLKKHMLCHKE